MEELNLFELNKLNLRTEVKKTMCRPLKEIVTELECKYAGQELTYDLEERRRFIADFDKSLTYLIDYSKKYEEDVEYAIGHKMSPDVIGRLTINLIVLMIHP